MPAEEAEIAAMVFIEMLDTQSVPASAYEELYKRAMQSRVHKLSLGQQPPDFTPELMLACWIGENGLRNELATREDTKVKKLTGHAESVCPRCNGTGWEIKKGEDRYTYAVHCDHNVKS